MFNQKKRSYQKMIGAAVALAIILVFLIPNLGAVADTAAGNSDSYSAVSSVDESSSQSTLSDISSDEISSEDDAPEMDIESFGTRSNPIVTHDMGTGPITVVNGNDYIITGTYLGPNAGITVPYGYVGTITLADASVITTDNAPAMILDNSTGTNLSNENPGTKVELILEGNNTLFSGKGSNKRIAYAGLDTGLGTQVTISGNGYLHAQSSTVTTENWSQTIYGAGGGAGIGSGGGGGPEYAYREYSYGGNVIIKSGNINAVGSFHGAGIGGGWYHNETNVIILGGNITSKGGEHSSGIGGGCYGWTSSGYLAVVIPDEETGSIAATGGESEVGDVSGSSIYVGDPKSPKNIIQTEDYLPGADIFIDFSKLGDLAKGLKQAGLSDTEIQNYYIGKTGEDGKFYLNAQVDTDLTFFTNAKDEEGTAYLAKASKLPKPGPTTVILPKAEIALKVALTTGTPKDLTFGVTPGTTQEQVFTITNESTNMSVKDLEITIVGLATDETQAEGDTTIISADNFEIITTTIPTTLDKASTTPLPEGTLGSNSIQITIRPKAGLAPGKYQVRLSVSGTLTDGLAVGAPGHFEEEIEPIVKNADTQTVTKKSTDGYVKATNLQPSNNWSNISYLDLEAVISTAGDKLESWKYAVTTSATAPADTDASWVSVTGETNKTAKYDFPANQENTYYVHWKLESTYVSAAGTLTTEDQSTVPATKIQTYKIDLIVPQVKSITTNVSSAGTNAFPVTVTFTEPVDLITAANITVTNGTITGTITPVGTAVNGRYTQYTFKVNANANVKDGDFVTIAIPEKVTKDKAGNENISSEKSDNGKGGINTNLSVPVNFSTPSIIYSFEDQKIFTTQPAADAITITIVPNGKENSTLYQVGTATEQEITSAYATNFIKVNGTAVNTGGYTAVLSKSGDNYVYTITSIAGFLDGAFEISILSDQVKNAEGNKLQATSQTFYVYIPQVTGISANPTNMDYQGGEAIITVEGVYLQYGTVEVYSSIDGQKHIATASEDGKTAQFIVTVPQNNDYVNSQNYTFSPLLNGADQSYSAGISVYRKPSQIIFDVNGGDLSSAPADIFQDMGTSVNVTAFQVGEASEPSYHGHVFMGWVYEDGTPVPDVFTMEPGVHKVIAQWLDLSKTLTSETVPYIVVKRDGATPEDIENQVGGQAEYTDAKGVVHKPKVEYSWDRNVLTESGVVIIRPYIADPKTGAPVYLEQITYLYVLNPPYIGGATYYVTFEGQSVPSDVFGVYAYGEEVDLENHVIRRVQLPVTYHGDGVDFQTAGLYNAYFTATFTDYFGETHNLRHNVQIKVMKAAGLSKEDQLKVDSSNFWVKVASIYHRAKPGETWEVTPENYMDGGRLVSTGEISSDAGYTYLVNVIVGKYVYMNPVALDQVRTSTAGGQMIANLEGRQLSINHIDFATNPNRTFEPKGHFDLRMSVQKNEQVSALIGDQMQMQLHFEMNRAWMAEPYFTLKVTDELVSAAEAGNTLYLFNYNPNTNGLELVGPMIPVNNGNFRIQMKGVYGDYVILAGLPSEANYKITDKTNTLSGGTVNEIGQNYVDSGRVLNLQEGLNAASTTRQNITADELFDSLKEYEAFTGEKISVEKNSKVMPIIGGTTGVLGIAAGFFLWKKKKNQNEN